MSVRALFPSHPGSWAIRKPGLYCLFLLFFLSGFFTAPAQNKNDPEKSVSGTVRGNIVDAQSKQPVEFATVTLFQRHTRITVNGSITNSTGDFVVEQILPGVYDLQVAFIGYELTAIDSLVIDEQTPQKNLGTIRLKPNAKILQGVTISADAGIFQSGIDKKVFNVEKSIVSEGGSASDVIRNIPTLSVDLDGNISLRGSGNITVLIDGKPSGLTGVNRAAILEQIPASSIESIELITNPSAKYDPDGMSGILNVILKKNKAQGFNGSASLFTGSRDKYIASLNLNYRNQKINLFASYNFRKNTRFGSSIGLRKNIFPDTTYSLNQYENNLMVSTTHMMRLGLDYSPNVKNEFGFNVTGNLNAMKETESIQNNNLNMSDVLTNIFFRDNTEINDGYSIDLTGNYKRTFENTKSALLASVSYSDNMNQSDFRFIQQNVNFDLTPTTDNPLLQNTYLHNTYKITTLQLDYTYPLSELSKFETGYKTILRDNDNNYQSESFNYAASAFQNDTAITNHFIYKEQIHSVYGIYSGGIKKLSYQIGCRAEQAYTSSQLINTNQDFTNNYFKIYPSAHLLKKLSGDQDIQLSYSRRVNRPNARNLNPFAEYTDPLNLRYGNPSLNPEYINSYELTYSKSLTKMSFSSTAYYREITGMIQQIRTVIPTGVSTIVFQNLASGTNYGFEAVARNDLFRWWNITSNINFYRTVIIGNNLSGELNNAGYSWFAKIISNITVWKNMLFQLAATYQAPAVIPQGTQKEMFAADLALKKELVKQNLTLGMTLSDIFDTRQIVTYTSAPDFYLYSQRKRESRIIYITLAYHFGKTDLKGKGTKIKEPEPESAD